MPRGLSSRTARPQPVSGAYRLARTVKRLPSDCCQTAVALPWSSMATLGRIRQAGMIGLQPRCRAPATTLNALIALITLTALTLLTARLKVAGPKLVAAGRVAGLHPDGDRTATGIDNDVRIVGVTGIAVPNQAGPAPVLMSAPGVCPDAVTRAVELLPYRYRIAMGAVGDLGIERDFLDIIGQAQRGLKGSRRGRGRNRRRGGGPGQRQA